MLKYPDIDKVISPYNPLVYLKQDIKDIVNKKFIQPKIEDFFLLKGIDMSFTDPLEITDMITEKDYNQTNIVNSYFYPIFFKNIKKQTDLKVKFKIKYTITFDCDITKKEIKSYKYGEIKLGLIPVMYYIYIDLQEMIRYIKYI